RKGRHQLAQPRPRVARDRRAVARQQNLDLEDADRVPACAAHGTCRRLLDAIIGWLRSRDRSVLEGKRSGHRLAVPELAGSLRDLEGQDREPARAAAAGRRAARSSAADPTSLAVSAPAASRDLLAGAKAHHSRFVSLHGPGRSREEPAARWPSFCTWPRSSREKVAGSFAPERLTG